MNGFLELRPMRKAKAGLSNTEIPSFESCTLHNLLTLFKSDQNFCLYGLLGNGLISFPS